MADSAGHWPPLQGVGRLGFQASISPYLWSWVWSKTATKVGFSWFGRQMSPMDLLPPSHDPRKSY